MSNKFLSLTNLNFLLFEVHQLERFLKHHYYSHQDKEAVDMMILSAMKIAEKHLHPYLKEMDRQQPELKNGEVISHKQIKKITSVFGESGWYSATISLDEGGLQIPHLVDSAANLIFMAANNGTYGFTGLNAGVSNLILKFASNELKEKFVPNLHIGKWQGTMALTEPQAGSSLGDISSSASRTSEEGEFKIKGQKVFISAGDLQHPENIVHMVLARIEGEPEGTKGISMFIVPKFRFEKTKLVSNDVKTVGIFHKMGQKATPTVHLAFGEKKNCIGYLVGEPNEGLSYMFELMNEARISVGIGAAGMASAAYYMALEYANERSQGRVAEAKDSVDQVSIIDHADVKRMLLKQKSIFEGCMSLILQAAAYADQVKTKEGDLRDHYQLLLDLLTPVVKTYPSEKGIESVSEALQCFGGYGYCEDFSVEQLYRDIRITPIYEGTTGIQSLDLLGRKVLLKNGKGMQLLSKEFEFTLRDASQFEELNEITAIFDAGADELKKVTQHLLAFAMRNKIDRYLADASVYMELFGLVCVGWQWLKQGVVITDACRTNVENLENPFYLGKIQTMKYFFNYEFPKTHSLSSTLKSDHDITLLTDKSWLE
ncbi:MAG: acyl-CoA dehydrogenase [Bacteroidetes bacterium]|nr:acyl-CoA dehydrogenase [Bacteroidota bacterium]MDA1119535.1 acyl-CoA dehydrogenase [Bacteroidota bacterium]